MKAVGVSCALSRIIPAVLLVLCIAMPAMADEEGTKIEQEIKALDMAWGEAAGKGDGAALNALLSEELYHVHATGTIENKTTYVESLASGKRKHAPIVPQQVVVRVYGDTAVSTGRFKMVAYKEGMPQPMVDQINLYTHVWRKTGKGWQLAVHQATAEGGMMKGGMMGHGPMGNGPMGGGMAPGGMMQPHH
ncbi:MAG: nuclear transport factor 2 family protein [Thermodesulfobacteriota bacterium]